MDVRRCAAHNRAGEQCHNPPIDGGTVCRMHGGGAPQVKNAAAERIAAMVDPALTALRLLVDTADSDSVRLSAIKDILDRAGYKPTDKRETTLTGGVNIYLPGREIVS